MTAEELTASADNIEAALSAWIAENSGDMITIIGSDFRRARRILARVRSLIDNGLLNRAERLLNQITFP